MKGLARVPSAKDMQKAYARLGHLDQSPLLPDEIVWFAMWTRFDPRLGELLTAYLSKHFKQLNAFDLAEKNKFSVWPQVLPVLLSQAGYLMKPKERRLFNHFETICIEGIPRAKEEIFFIGIHLFAGKLMRQEALRTIEPYKKWGYLCSKLMIPDRYGIRLTLLKKTERLLRIREFLSLKRGMRFRIRELAEYLDFKVHIRQLERDLLELHVRFTGNTKSRCYEGS